MFSTSLFPSLYIRSQGQDIQARKFPLGTQCMRIYQGCTYLLLCAPEQAGRGKGERRRGAVRCVCPIFPFGLWPRKIYRWTCWRFCLLLQTHPLSSSTLLCAWETGLRVTSTWFRHPSASFLHWPSELQRDPAGQKGAGTASLPARLHCAVLFFHHQRPQLLFSSFLLQLSSRQVPRTPPCPPA